MTTISLGKAIALAIFSAGLGSLATGAVLKNAPAADKPLASVTAAEIPAAAPAASIAETPALTVTSTAPPESGSPIDVETAMAERAIGQDGAPLTIIEYASMTCDHCADFHNRILPEIKKALIDTGQARLVYRDMPWDKFALAAAKIARCAPREKYFEVAGAIFGTHDNWAHSPDPLKGLRGIATAAGMDEKYIDACLADEALETAILKAQQEGRRDFDVNSTPAFIFMKDGARQQSYPAFEEIFKKLASDHKH